MNVIKKFRKALGLSRPQFAELLGLSVSRVNQFETEIPETIRKRLLAIAEAKQLLMLVPELRHPSDEITATGSRLYALMDEAVAGGVKEYEIEAALLALLAAARARPDRHQTMRDLDFRRWLMQQKLRQDSVGDLAREVELDAASPLKGTDLLTYLRKRAPAHPLQEAVKRFKAARAELHPKRNAG